MATATSAVSDVAEQGTADAMTRERTAPAPAPLRRPGLWLAALCVLTLAILLIRISAFGIWDPWELEAADAARRLAAGEHPATGTVSFTTWLVSLGFRAFGVHEWAGRLPVALAGGVVCATAYLLGRRFADARTGLYAGLLSATTPLFVFNARTMLGAAPNFAIQGALALACCAALFPPNRPETQAPRTLPWLLGALVLSVLAVSTRGALVSALPPLIAASLTALYSGADARGSARRVCLPALGAVTLCLIALVVRDVARDAANYSVWIGGRAASAGPTTFDAVVEEVYHAFAPWSALLPIALGRLWLTSLDPDNAASGAVGASERSLRSFCFMWIALGYGAQTLFLSRYGHEVAFLPLVALSVLVAMLLRDIERSGESRWDMGIAAFLLTGLVLRDFAEYPSGPIQGLPIARFDVPDRWHPTREFFGLLTPFALAALFGFGVGAPAGTPRLDLAAPYRFLRSLWRRGWRYRTWLAAFGLTLLTLVVVGALAYAIPHRMHLTTLATKWLRRLLYAPFALALACALAQIVAYAFARWNRARFLPLLAAGAIMGVYASQVFLPNISEQFSPREVYTTYNAFARPGEALAEYQVSGRAAAYYAKGEVIDVTRLNALIDHLAGPGRHWAAFPYDELPEIDHQYRRRTGRHLVVIGAHSGRITLATNEAVKGRKDENPLRDAVLDHVPNTIGHRVSVDFDHRIELLGYTTELPHGSYVGAGESFKVTWYFRTLRRIPTGYKIFVHIDGSGQRIHGDHVPVDARYPVQLWEEGDIIADVQTIDVPSSNRPGDYAIMLGFYSGEKRLPIESGPNDGDNRARLGVLRIE